MKKTIHTTLSVECHDWLYRESDRRKIPINEVIEGLVAFYRKNREISDQFISARLFLKQLIAEELVDLDLIERDFKV